MLLPIRAGNSNRSDLLAIRDSILQGLGNQFTNIALSNVDIVCDALARAVYNVWQVYGNVSGQFDPNTMDTMLSRWETIMNLQPLSTDALDVRRARVALKFALINEIPTNANIVSLMSSTIPQIFKLLITIPEVSATGGGIPSGINGGLETLISGAGWYSTACSIYIDVHRPSNISQSAFWSQAFTIFPALNLFMPAFAGVDWFTSTFNNSDGAGHQATFTMVEGFTAATTTYTTLTNAACGVVPGAIIELADDTGKWWRLTVASITSNTSLQMTSTPANFTNQPFWIAGYFADCDSTTFPYPINAYNQDNAGI